MRRSEWLESPQTTLGSWSCTLDGTVGNHMVAAVYQDDEWLILDNLTNVLLRDSEKTDYEPTMILDYKGIRRYSSAFWLD